ncbi:MAG: hypothetical protein KAQ64_00060 [Candidatus Pacebacteria bacterium]|nr:hypothetical protein [Candidatus Paceibacterota bacterium]
MNNEKLAIMLFENGHIKFRESGSEHGFKFKFHDEHLDAPGSPSYFNFRDLSDEILSCIGRLFNELVKEREIKFDRIVGLPKAGDPLAKVFAKMAGRSDDLVFLEKEESDGKRIILPHIIGKYDKGEVVLPIDDVVNKGHTKIEGIKPLKDNDLAVIDCIVLVDRQQGGVELLHELGIEVHFLFTLEEILEIYIKNKFISEEVAQEILNYPRLVEEYINNLS